MAEAVQAADDDTLVVFDIDNTLIEPVGNLGSDQWYDFLVRSIGRWMGFRRRRRSAGLTLIWNEVQWIIEVKAVEPDTPQLIRGLQDRSVKLMGLTRPHPRDAHAP